MWVVGQFEIGSPAHERRDVTQSRQRATGFFDHTRLLSSHTWAGRVSATRTTPIGRVHQTLRVTPAMQAGIASHVWSIEEIVGLLD